MPKTPKKPPIELKCALCGTRFFLKHKVHKARLLNGVNDICCSILCANQLKGSKKKGNAIPFGLFNRIIVNARTADRKKNTPNNLTAAHLQQVWENQNGICPLTGWQMLLPQPIKQPDGRDRYFFVSKNPCNLSLDRLDNSKGHVKGNVRFVCLMANYARNDFNDDEVKAFCRAVAINENKL